MKIDGTGKIGSFAEKPTGDALKAMEVDTRVLGLPADKAKVRRLALVHGRLALVHGRGAQRTASVPAAAQLRTLACQSCH